VNTFIISLHSAGITNIIKYSGTKLSQLKCEKDFALQKPQPTVHIF
jgi:hypothetical protein